ncbi:MAG: dienelactone hydrolase family protein [Chloroflexi bacterium]|nr:dienelactone hydrolase family protein [Chloroflexota bacterium]
MPRIPRATFLKLAGGATLGAAGLLSSGARAGVLSAGGSTQVARDPVPRGWDAPAEHELTDVTADGLRGRLTRPARPNGAGIVLMPSWPGLGPGTDEYANWLADAGFTVVGWDPFSAYDPSIDSDTRRGITQGLLDTDARKEHIRWVDYLGDLGVQSFGTVGTCMGGRMAMLLGAGDPRVKACSAFYPSLRPQPLAWELDVATECKEMETAVQIHFPMEDTVTPYQRIRDVRPVLESRPGLSTTVVGVYPGAHHGFLGLNPERDPADLAATYVSWPATIAFFRATLL